MGVRLSGGHAIVRWRPVIASAGPGEPHRSLDAYEPEICKLLAEYPTMPPTVIGERIAWPHLMTVLKVGVRAIRSEYRGVDPADRIEHKPGDTTQCDLWFPIIVAQKYLENATSWPLRGCYWSSSAGLPITCGGTESRRSRPRRASRRSTPPPSPGRGRRSR